MLRAWLVRPIRGSEGTAAFASACRVTRHSRTLRQFAFSLPESCRNLKTPNEILAVLRHTSVSIVADFPHQHIKLQVEDFQHAYIFALGCCWGFSLEFLPMLCSGFPIRITES
jgi:hypothetical protein